MVVCSKRRLMVRILLGIPINRDLVYQSPPRGGSTAMCVVAHYIRAVNFPKCRGKISLYFFWITPQNLSCGCCEPMARSG